jgi:lactoylglutathione lyase
MSERPFQILGVEQIAIGNLDLNRLRNLWIDTLGLKSEGEFTNETENVNGMIAFLGVGPGKVSMNFLEPIDPDRSPRAHRPALNHIGLWVDDLPAAIEWLKEKGIGFTPRGIRVGAASHDIAFIHPNEGGEGVLIELVQAPPELIEQHQLEAESQA